jgi:hypothetical protein
MISMALVVLVVLPVATPATRNPDLEEKEEALVDRCHAFELHLCRFFSAQTHTWRSCFTLSRRLTLARYFGSSADGRQADVDAKRSLCNAGCSSHFEFFVICL